MNKEIFKSITILSLSVGAVFGLLSAIPYIGGIALFGYMFFTAPVVLVLLIMAGKADLATPKESIINGAVSGFFSNITFSFAYAVIVAILFLTIKYSSNYFLTAMIINSPVWLFVTVVVFVGVLSATTNAFSGFMTYYIINFIRDIYEKKTQSKEGKNGRI